MSLDLCNVGIWPLKIRQVLLQILACQLGQIFCGWLPFPILEELFVGTSIFLYSIDLILSFSAANPTASGNCNTSSA